MFVVTFYSLRNALIDRKYKDETPVNKSVPDNLAAAEGNLRNNANEIGPHRTPVAAVKYLKPPMLSAPTGINNIPLRIK